MKASILLAGSSAALVAAQATFPDGFPACGVNCFESLLGASSEFGCENANAACLCAVDNFNYGVRDCATEACPDQSTANQVISYGNTWCADAGVTPSSSTGMTSTTSGGSTTTSGGSTTTSGDSTTTSGSGSTTATSGTSTGTVTGLVPISTESTPTTITSDGSTYTSFSTSVIYSSGMGTYTGPVTSTDVPTTITSDGMTMTSSVPTTVPVTESNSATEGTTTGTESTETGTTTTESGESPTESPTTTTSDGLAAQQTAAPVGFVAAAGLAALLF